jgi:tyrosine-protein kinase Etk/Wzc
MAESAIDGTGRLESSTAASMERADELDSIDLAKLQETLRRGSNTIFGATLGAAVIAAAIAFLLPVRYTSAASFIPPNLNSGSTMASTLAGQLSALGGGDILGGVKSPGDLYAGILMSRSIADGLIRQFHLMEVFRVKKMSQAEKILGSNTIVAVDQKSSIVTVEVTAKSPQLAHDLANAYMDGLRETNGRLALDQSSQRRIFFGEQLEKEKDDLADAEVELKKTEEKSGLIAPSGQTQSEITTIAQTQAQIAVREVQLAALRDSATEQNPDVIRLRSEIDDLQGQLARLQRGGSSGSVATIPTAKVPEVELEYVRKDRDVKYHEALFDMLSRQYEAARLDEARDAPVIQVLDTASFPDTKSSPKRTLILLAGLVLGFLAGCLWVLLRERLKAFRSNLVVGAA